MMELNKDQRNKEVALGNIMHKWQGLDFTLAQKSAY